jgi:hypothetical protein
LIGELHPRWVQKYELGTAPVLFELELPALLSTPFPGLCRGFTLAGGGARSGLGGAADASLAPLLAA